MFSRTSPTPLWSYTTGSDLESVDISSNGDYIVAESEDEKVYLFHKSSNNLLWSYTLDGTQGNGYYCVSISSDGKYIAAGGLNNFYYFRNFYVNGTYRPLDRDDRKDDNNHTEPEVISIVNFHLIFIVLGIIYVIMKIIRKKHLKKI